MAGFPDGEDNKAAPESGAEAVEPVNAAEPEQFGFAAQDEHLPWLEGDEEYEEGGVDTGRIVAFALIGLLLLGAIVGGIWWAGQTRADPEMVADGSVIEAPEGPYKTRPEDPGGKVHEGTGDTSFAVAEGQSREGQIADARPSIDRVQGEAPASGGVGVQVGAYSSREAAERGWGTLTGQYSALSGLRHRIVEGKADIGTVYRLQAVAGSTAAANELCRTLRDGGAPCQVKP